MKHIGSVFTDEQELLKSLIKLYCPHGVIDCDPMFFKGNFYGEGIVEPYYAFDINPQREYVKQADARQLPLSTSSINSMILDPPFMFGNHGKQKEYYSSKTHGIFKTWNDLRFTYQDILSEAHRVLAVGGILIFKCQDYTDNKTVLTHCWVNHWAIGEGFQIEDIAILYLPKNKVSNHNLKQRHLRKHHSYFMVFRNKK